MSIEGKVIDEKKIKQLKKLKDALKVIMLLITNQIS